MKNLINNLCPAENRRRALQLLIRMKLIFVFLLVGMLTVHAEVSSQVYSFSVRSAPLREVIRSIEMQGDYRFFFSDDVTDLNRPVQVEVANATIDQLLDKLLTPYQLSYQIMENNLIIISPYNSVPQGVIITGTITDASGESLPGVNVVIKGTTNGVISNSEGRYSITVPDRNAVLLFSFIGFFPQEIAVANRTSIDVALVESISDIGEVVVVGYGTQRKENLTGSMAVVNMERILGDRPITNVGAALQGTVPGLQITGGASPGAGKTFNIRGVTSITETSSGSNTLPGPLILIDNVEGQINLVNPEDIETITVLKDAASAAIYGARAAYGVILITTKRAKRNSKMTLNYNNNFAFEKVTNQLNPASVKEIVSAFNEWSPGGSWLDGQSYSNWLSFIDDYRSNPSAFQSKAGTNGDYFNPKWGIYKPNSEGVYYYLKDNDAQNEVFDNYGFQQTHNLSASGGSETITYRLSMGYTDHNGPLKTSKDSYKRYNVAAFVSADVTTWMNTSLDIRYSQATRKEMESDWGDRIFDLKYYNFLPGADSWPVANNMEGTAYLNTAPLNYLLNCDPRTTRNENPRVFSRTTITPFKGFEGVIEYTFDENVYDRRMYPLRPDMLGPQLINLTNADVVAYRKDKTTSRYNSFNAYGTYSLSLAEKHNFKLMAGYSQERRYYEALWASRKEAITMDNPSITGSEGEILAGDSYTDYSIRSGFFRFNYNYDSKYLLEVNGRYDGSSKFPKEYRFGFFPSFSAGWQVAREGFMEWASGWLDEFKIRGSWGEIGNQSIDNYLFLPQMSVSSRSNWINGGERPLTLNAPAMVRSNFTWERAATLDFGVDISALKNRFQATFDWYQRDTKGMLGPVDEYPSVVGATAPLQNAADLRTKGFELSVNWRDQIGKWGYSIGFNLTDYQSHITKYNNEQKLFYDRNSAYSVANRRYYEGMKFGEIWGYVFDRFYTVDDFEDTTSWQLKEGVTSLRGYSPRPGDIMFKNLRDDETSENEIYGGDSTVDNPGDRKIIGNETLRFQYGINASVSYKGVALSVFLQGVGKRDAWLGGDIIFPLTGTNDANDNTGTVYKHQVGQYAQVKDAANGDYTLINPDAYLPRLYGQPSTNASNKRLSDRYLQDASYLRVKNITLSYSFPRNLIQTVGLSNARIFVSGENMFTFSNLPKGVDPERLSWGYPFYAVYSFGLNITL